MMPPRLALRQQQHALRRSAWSCLRKARYDEKRADAFTAEHGLPSSVSRRLKRPGAPCGSRLVSSWAGSYTPRILSLR